MEMSKLEKVIKGLGICTKDIPMSNAIHKSDLCKECPYYNAKYSYCWNQIAMMRDALALLEEQKEEIENLKQTAQSMMEGVCLLKEQEVVQCKDCKYSVDIGGKDIFGKPLLACRKEWIYSERELLKYPDGYCDEGKRKE